jgi:tetratricopeptide (TPR) repeat protein
MCPDPPLTGPLPGEVDGGVAALVRGRCRGGPTRGRGPSASRLLSQQFSRCFAAGLAVLALVSLTCATLPPCPAKGGPTWTELTSDHFRLRTDLDAEVAAEAIRTLEEIRAAMLALVWPNARVSSQRIEVVVLRSSVELSTYLQGGADGIRTQPRPFPATIVVGGIAEAESLTILEHELAHELSHQFLPLEPPWYSEGIAAFLETIAVDHGHRTARLGDVSESRIQSLVGLGRTPADELLATRRLPEHYALARFEASSWLLVHFLLNERLEAFGRFQRRLILLARPEEAWSEEFPGLSVKELDRELDRYSTSGRYTTYTIKLDVPDPNFHRRQLSDAEVHGLRALLYLAAVSPGNRPQEAAARGEVAEAFAQDPGALEALAVAFYGLTDARNLEARKDLATRATSAHPESWLAWVMLADTGNLKARDTQDVLARALELARDQPEVLSRLALANAIQGHWDQALEFSTKALALRAPFGILPLHAEALARTGNCREAARLTEQLAQWAGEPQAAGIRRAWSDKLSPICLAAAGAAPAPGPVVPADSSPSKEPVDPH